MTYQTFEVAIVTSQDLKFIEVVAISLDAAKADVVEAYGAEVEIAYVSIL